MESDELAAVLQLFPPVDFCCAYGSALLTGNPAKEKTMIDYIFGVSDPVRWHYENMERNRGHYASWMAYLGPETVTKVADKVGVGVHFNPFVILNQKQLIKYGVVRTDDLIKDLVHWKTFYLSGRLQKPVTLLVDKLNIARINTVNLKAAIAASLLLLPSVFTEEELYTKICSLSYMGDIRMLFAEDRDKVQKIVQGHIRSFQKLYRPFVQEYGAEDILRFSSFAPSQRTICQDCSAQSTTYLVSCLPQDFRSHIIVRGKVKQKLCEPGWSEVSKCLEKAVRRKVLCSSGRQAISGVLAVGCINAMRYLAAKMSKVWI